MRDLYYHFLTCCQLLKGNGHVPDTSWVLRDVEEEEKYEDLCFHAEKMALAYPSTVLVNRN
jgi:hypothetical protein